MSRTMIYFNIVESNPPVRSDNVNNIFEIIPNITVSSTYVNSRLSYKLVFQTNSTYTNRFYIDDELKTLSAEKTLLLDYTLTIIQKTTYEDYNPVILKIDVTNSSGQVVRGTVSFTIEDIKLYSDTPQQVFNNHWQHALSFPNSDNAYNYFKIEPLLPKSDSDLALQSLTMNSIKVEIRFLSISSGTYKLYFDDISITPQINGTTTISLNNTDKKYFYIWTKTDIRFSLNIQITHNFTLVLDNNIYRDTFLNELDNLFTGLIAPTIVTIDSTSNIQSIGGNTTTTGSHSKDAIVEINVFSQTNPLILLQCRYTSSRQTKINLTLDTNIIYSTITTTPVIINQTIPANTQIVALEFTKTVVPNITNLLNPFIIQGVNFSEVDIYIDQIKHASNDTVFHLNKATVYQILILNKTGVATNVHIDCSDNLSVVIYEDSYGIKLPTAFSIIRNSVIENISNLQNIIADGTNFTYDITNKALFRRVDNTSASTNDIVVSFTHSGITYKYYIELTLEAYVPVEFNIPLIAGTFNISPRGSDFYQIWVIKRLINSSDLTLEVAFNTPNNITIDAITYSGSASRTLSFSKNKTQYEISVDTAITFTFTITSINYILSGSEYTVSIRDMLRTDFGNNSIGYAHNEYVSNVLNYNTSTSVYERRNSYDITDTDVIFTDKIVVSIGTDTLTINTLQIEVKQNIVGIDFDIFDSDSIEHIDNAFNNFLIQPSITLSPSSYPRLAYNLAFTTTSSNTNRFYIDNVEKTLTVSKILIDYTPITTSPLTLGIEGLTGWYEADSFDVSSQTWVDLSGSGNNAWKHRGTVSKNETGLNERPIIYGGTADGIQFPVAALGGAPTTYTIFTVAKYGQNQATTGTRGRIFDSWDGGAGNNWLNGFWNGSAGVAHHGQWITGTTDNHGYNWVLSSSQHSMYRSNGIDRTIANANGVAGPTTLYINSATESSDWSVAEVILYNGTNLTEAEYIKIEEYLNGKYNISSNIRKNYYDGFEPVVLKIVATNSSGEVVKGTVSFTIEDVKLQSPQIFNNDWQHTISYPVIGLSNNLWNIEPLLPKAVLDTSLISDRITVKITFESAGSGTHDMYIDDEKIIPSSGLTKTISLTDKTNTIIYTKTTIAFTVKITIQHYFTLLLDTNIYRGAFLNRLNDLFSDFVAPATVTIDSNSNIQTIENNINGDVEIDVLTTTDPINPINPIIELQCDFMRARIYPPSPFPNNEVLNETTKTHTLKGNTYGNGTYNLAVSSVLNWNKDFDVDNLMDEGAYANQKSEVGWHSAGGSVTNQWFIIDLPVAIEPMYYILVNRKTTNLDSDGYSKQMVKDWRFEGSIDYNHSANTATWEVISHRLPGIKVDSLMIEDALFYSSEARTFNVNTNGKKYSAFRWYWLNNNGDLSYMVIKEILLYGAEFIPTKINLTLDFSVSYTPKTDPIVINQTIAADTQIIAIEFTKTIDPTTEDNNLNPFTIHDVVFSDVDIYIDRIKHITNDIVFHSNKATAYQILILNKTGVATNVHIDCSDNVSVIIHADMYGVQLPNSVKMINTSNEIATISGISSYTIIDDDANIFNFDNNSIFVKPDITGTTTTGTQSNILVTFTESLTEYKYYIKLIVEEHIPTTITHSLPFSARFFRNATESISVNTPYRYLGFYGYDVGESGPIFNEIELTLGTPLNGFNSIKHGVNDGGITFHESKMWHYHIKVNNDLTTIMNGNKNTNELRYKTVGQSAGQSAAIGISNPIAFHHGNFDINDYGDANVGAAALAGRFYADTDTPFKFAWGTLNSVSMTDTATTYTWTPLGEVTADVLMVAGGGGGGAISGGGGGAGGLIYLQNLLLNGQKNIVVGNGGIVGSNGNSTSFDSTIVSNGGGAGGPTVSINLGYGSSGASGGGGGRDSGAFSGGSSVKSTNEFGNDGGGALILNSLIGTQATNPACNALHILSVNPDAPSGNYWIKPSNYTGAAILLWCEMTKLGGGWVLIGKGRESSDASGGWFGTNNEINTAGLQEENAFLSGVSKVSSSFVNHLMNGTNNGWDNDNSNNYLVANRIDDAEDGHSGIGDSLYFKVTNETEFLWVNQFGSSVLNTQPATGSGVNKRYNSTWHTGGQYGNQESTFNDVYYGGGNSTNRSFTWHWSGHGNYHGWSSGWEETRGFQNGTEGHAIQFVQLWARGQSIGWCGAGGGGGAGGPGFSGGNPDGSQYSEFSGNGGVGMNFSNYFGTQYGDDGWFAGGGGGHNSGTNIISQVGIGGTGGGGNGAGTTTGISSTSGQKHTGGGGGGYGGTGGSGIVLIKFQLEASNTIYWYMDLGLEANVSRGSFWTDSNAATAFGGGKLYGTNTDPSTFIDASSTSNWNFICNLNKNPSTSPIVSNLGFGKYMYYSYSFSKPPTGIHNVELTLNLINYDADDTKVEIKVDDTKPLITPVKITNKVVSLEIKTLDPTTPFNTSFNYQWKYQPTAKSLESTTSNPLDLLADPMEFFTTFLSTSPIVAINSLQLVPSTSTLSFDNARGLVYRTTADLENFTLTATYTIRTTIDTEYENNTIAMDIPFRIPAHTPEEYEILLPTANILTVAKDDTIPPNFYQAWEFKRPISSDDLDLKAILTFESEKTINDDNLKVKLLNGDVVVATSGNLQTARIHTFTRAEIVQGTYNYTIRLNDTTNGNIINYALNGVALNEAASGSSSVVVQSVSPTAKIGLSIKAQRSFKVDITEINKNDVAVTLLRVEDGGDVEIATSGNLQTTRMHAFTHTETVKGTYNYTIRLNDTVTGNITNYALDDVVLIDHPTIVEPIIIDTGTELGDKDAPLNQLKYNETTTDDKFVYTLSSTDLEIEIQYDYIENKWISGLLSVSHDGSSVVITNATFDGLDGRKLLASFTDPYYADTSPTIITPINPQTTNLNLSVTTDGLSFSVAITGIYKDNIGVQLLKGEGILVMNTENILDLYFTNANEVYLLSTNDPTIEFNLQTSIDSIRFRLNADQYRFSIRDLLRADFGALTTYTHNNFASTALIYDSTSTLYEKIDLYRPTNTTVSFYNKIEVSYVPINNLQITLTGISPIEISNFHKHLLNVSIPRTNFYAVYQITPGNATGSTDPLFDNIGAVTFNIKNDRTDESFLSGVNVQTATGDVRKDYQLFQNFRSIDYVDDYGRDISNLSSYSNGNLGTNVDVYKFQTDLYENGWYNDIDNYQRISYTYSSWFNINDKTIAVSFSKASEYSAGFITKALPLGTKQVIIQYYNPLSAPGTEIYCNIYENTKDTKVATNTQQSGLSEKPGETILTIPESSNQHYIQIMHSSSSITIPIRDTIVIAIEYIICVFEEDVPPSPQLTYDNITTFDYASDTTFKLVLFSPSIQTNDIIVEIFRNPTIDDCHVFLRRTITQQPTFTFINAKKSTEATSLQPTSTCASSGINHFIPKLSKDMYFDDDKLYFTLYFDFERRHLENDSEYYKDTLKNMSDNMATRYSQEYVHKVFYIDVNGEEKTLTMSNYGEYSISRNSSTFWFATVKVQIFEDSDNSIFEVARLCELTTAIAFENTATFFQSENKQMNYIFNPPSLYSLHFTLDNFFVPSNYTCELHAYYTNSAGITQIGFRDNLVDNTTINFTNLTAPGINSTSRIHVMLVFTSTSNATEVILANNYSSALVYVGADTAVPRFQENHPILLNKYAPAIEIEAVVLDGLFPNYEIELKLNNDMIINVLSEHIYSRVEEDGKRRFILKLPYADYEEFFNNANIGNNMLNIKLTSGYDFTNSSSVKTTKTITNNKTIDMNYDVNSKTIMSCVIQ